MYDKGVSILSIKINHGIRFILNHIRKRKNISINTKYIKSRINIENRNPEIWATTLKKINFSRLINLINIIIETRTPIV